MKRRLTSPGLWLPRASRDAAFSEFATERLGISTWMSFKEVTGEPFPIAGLIADLGKHDFRATFIQACRVVSVGANCEGGPVGTEATALTVSLLGARPDSSKPIERAVSRFVRAQSKPRAVVHERVAYLLLSMATMYCGTGGDAPTFDKIAFWLLILNDHLPDWEPDGRTLRKDESLLADFWAVCRFNRGDHRGRDFVRGAELFRRAPPHGELAARWDDVQQQAFGMSHEEYVTQLAAPLAMLSHTWGVRRDDNTISSPVLRPIEWCGGSLAHAAFFAARTWTRDDAQAFFSSSLSADGVPQRIAQFRRFPFMFDQGDVLVASPWAMRDSLSLATWGAFRSAQQSLLGGNAMPWLQAFGYLVELWCRRVAEAAAPGIGAHGGRVILSDHPGSDDEIEDVIFAQGNRTFLFAVKARLAPDRIARVECSRGDAADWVEQFFFAKPSKSAKMRGGVMRLLDSKARRIRAGEVASIARDSFIIPVVVTYDPLGDNLALYDWLYRRCAEERLLQQQTVRPVSLMSVAEFEAAMSLAACGADIARALARWSPKDHLLSTERLLRDADDTVDFDELPLFKESFDRLWLAAEAYLEKLFAVAPRARSE